MNRDELARNQWIGIPMSQAERDARAREWDARQVKPEDVADCYARADRQLRNGGAS